MHGIRLGLPRLRRLSTDSVSENDADERRDGALGHRFGTNHHHSPLSDAMNLQHGTENAF